MDYRMKVLTKICDYYSYKFRLYPDGRIVLQMMNANTKDTDLEWRGKDDCGQKACLNQNVQSVHAAYVRTTKQINRLKLEMILGVYIKHQIYPIVLIAADFLMKIIVAKIRKY